MSNWQWQTQWQAQYNQLMSFLHLLVREPFIRALDNLLCAFRNCGFIFIGCAELQWRKLYGYKKTLTIPQISQLIHSICYTFHRLLTMPSTRTTKWVFCYDFHLVCSKFEPVIFRSKSHSKASVKKPASEILAEEVSPQVAPARWVFFFCADLLQTLSKICRSAYPVKVGDKRRAPVTSDSEMFVFVWVRFSVPIFWFFFVVKFLKPRQSTRRRRWPSDLLLDHLSLRIFPLSLFRMSFYLPFYGLITSMML